jgi:hypothetical protein
MIFARLFIAALVVLAVVPAYGRVPSQMFCWTPDAEFPVACDYEDEEEHHYASTNANGRTPSGGALGVYGGKG